jgi:carbon storage regulator CsrA
MLVLSRKSGEKISIDGTIEVTVLKLKGNKVSLGIRAPKDVKILRGELHEDWTLSEGDSRLVNGENCITPTVHTTVSREPSLAWSI